VKRDDIPGIEPHCIDREQAEYESYKDNRFMGVAHETLRDWFGRDRADAFQARHRAEREAAEAQANPELGATYYLVVDNLTGCVRSGARSRMGAPSGCRSIKVREVKE
jgi:hypothetical protein